MLSAGLVPAALGAVSDTQAPKAPSSLEQPQLTLFDEPLKQLLQLLMRTNPSFRFVVGNAKPLDDVKVTANVRGQDFDGILSSVLTPHGIPWYKDDQGVYQINAVKPAPPAPVTPTLPTVSQPTGGSASRRVRYVTTDVIQLMHVSATEALSALGVDDSMVRKAYPDQQQGFVNRPYAAPVLNPGAASGARGTIGIPDRVSVDFRQYPEPAVTVEDQSGSGSLTPGAATPIEGAPQDPSLAQRAPEERDSFGQTRPGGTGTRTGGFNPRPAGSPGAATQPGTTGGQGTASGSRGFVPEGIDLLAGLITDNSIMAQGDPDAIDELRQIIRYIDVAPQQVVIRADLVSVTTSANDQTGFNLTAFLRDFSLNAQTGAATAAGGLIIDVVRGNLQAAFASLRSSGKGRVISSPMVRTMNNTPAYVNSYVTTPIFQSQVSQNNNTTVTAVQVTGVQATTGLFVTPRINRDGTITMSITPQLQDITGTVIGPNGETAPIISSTDTTITAQINSGETMVIAGLNKKSVNDSETRIPLLGDIPLIGNLFRNRVKSISDTQMLIFVTPTIVTAFGGTKPVEQ